MKQPGDKVDDLLGLDQNDNEIRLSQFPGKRIVLYFYPKDNTSGCTAEACGFRDNIEAFRAKGYEIIGVSTDSATSHKKFIDKHSLPFTLITDPDHHLAEEFGVWGEKTMCGRKYMGLLRSTFLISPEGIVEERIDPKKIKTKTHAADLLSTL